MDDTLVGFALNILACFAFGFMFVPLRKLDCKNGLFVQWIYSIAVLLVGFIVNCARRFPPFLPLAMVGGAVSAAGSLVAVPMMKNLGLSVGMFLWGDVQAVTGWTIARFGLFGTKPQPVYNNAMNITGVAVVVVSGVMFAFVNHQTQQEEIVTKDRLFLGETNGDRLKTVGLSSDEIPQSILNRKGSYDIVSLKPKCSHRIQFSLMKLLYIGLAVIIGVSHGFNMTPITYIIENYKDASHDVLDHIFPHYLAVTICTTVFFMGYCIFKRNHPYTRSELILPSFVYGILWSGGMVLFFIANRLLSQTVSYPITMRLPSTITLMADLLLFRTIKGAKNVIYTIFAVSLGIFGILLIAFSNQKV